MASVEIIVAAVLSSILSSTLTWFISTRHRHIYCVYKQSADIMEITNKEFIFSLNITETSIPVNNFYTTKVSIVNAGFSEIKNNTPNQNPLIIEFPKECKIIGYRKKRGIEDDGFILEIDEKRQNIFKVKFTGFNKGEKIYFEIFCIDGEKGRPKLRTSYKPMKCDVIEAYEDVEATDTKKIWWIIFSLSFLILLLFSKGIFDIIKRRYLYHNLMDCIFFIFGIVFAIFMASVSIYIIRKINLLTFPHLKDDEIESILIENRILRKY